jgi:hypothetical protein
MINAKRLALAAALMALPPLLAAPAEARGGVHFGIGIGIPAYPAYPVYPAYPYPYAYPPPAYYAPPYPAYVPPGPYPYSVPQPAGQACYAGAYVCPLDRAATPGDACACPSRDGRRAWGRVG